MPPSKTDVVANGLDRDLALRLMQSASQLPSGVFIPGGLDADSSAIRLSRTSHDGALLTLPGQAPYGTYEKPIKVFDNVPVVDTKQSDVFDVKGWGSIILKGTYGVSSGLLGASISIYDYVSSADGFIEHIIPLVASGIPFSLRLPIHSDRIFFVWSVSAAVSTTGSLYLEMLRPWPYTPIPKTAHYVIQAEDQTISGLSNSIMTFGGHTFRQGIFSYSITGLTGTTPSATFAIGSPNYTSSQVYSGPTHINVLESGILPFALPGNGGTVQLSMANADNALEYSYALVLSD